VAIAGGVNVLCSPKLFISFAKAGMLSPDGRCKTFDRAANGYVRGEGVGALLLKPLSRAIADGDHIYGVIKGTAVNHGGHVSSLTVPNPNAQADLLIAAYEQAQFDPRTISYVEAHGTGTPLGDPRKRSPNSRRGTVTGLPSTPRIAASAR
jgi:acyl transferase domain-containing protein